MSPLIAIIFLGTVTLLFGSALLFVASLLGPKPKYSSVKDSSYECGLEVQETGHSKVPIKFYLTAILFILFDIEIIFMYPWAVTYLDFVNEGHGVYIFSVMAVFLLIFILGLIWEIKSKALEWE